MLRPRIFVSGATALLLTWASLAFSCAALAQTGPGGGHTGGGVATGGGLSGGGVGGASGGIDAKDDLKNFHTLLAVQATTPQIAQYSLMLKSEEAARAEVRTFLNELTQQNDHAQFVVRGAEVGQAIERARGDAQKYLDSFSEPQKSGLREISKRLLKDDSDLAQQARMLTVQIKDSKASPQTLEATTKSLELALTNLRNREAELGDEMSISVADHPNSRYDLAPVSNSIHFADQLVAMVTEVEISRGTAESGKSAFTFELNEDLSDLQQNITEVLRSQLDKSERCGEQVEIQDAALTPLVPASLIALQLHYERWTCLGRDNVNEIVEGNGSIEVKLTPVVGKGGELQFKAEISRIEAPGLLGELLRSGPLGDTLRDKAAEVVEAVAQRGSDLQAVLPSAARGHATLARAQFHGTGMGRLTMVMTGDIDVAGDDAKSLAGELERKSSSAAVQQAVSR